MTNAPSTNDLRAAFTFSRFELTVSKPSYETLFKLENQEIRNAARVEIRFPPPHTNLYVIIKHPAVYILGVGAPFPRLPYPGNTAHFHVGETLVQRQNIQAAYYANIKSFLTCQTTENILKSLLESLIEHSYLAVIHSVILDFGVRSLQGIFPHVYQSYGRVIPAALQLNTTRLTTPIASHLSIALIF